MPINVQCSCGKRMILGDALAGKSVRCSACGNDVVVKAGSSAAAGKTAAKGAKSSPRIYISTGKIVAIVAVILVAILGLLFVTGPMRVWNQWENMGPKTHGDVSDVLTFALQAYLSENGDYNPAKPHLAPAVEADDVHFFRPTLVMSMPQKVAFEGKSNQGDFKGTYDTTNGEIEADINIGGYSVAGLVDVRKSTGSFHITGREGDNGQPQAEVNGQKLVIVWPKKEEP